MEIEITDLPYVLDADEFRNDPSFRQEMVELITGDYGVCAGDSILYHRPHQRYEFLHSITPDGLITELITDEANTEPLLRRYHVENAVHLLGDKEFQLVSEEVLLAPDQLVGEYLDAHLQDQSQVLARTNPTPGYPTTTWGGMRDAAAVIEIRPKAPSVGDYTFTRTQSATTDA